MANNSTTKIQIPVAFVAAQDSTKSILANLQDLQKGMKFDSTSWQRLGVIINGIQGKMVNIQKITNKGFIDEKDFESLQSAFIGINKEVAKLGNVSDKLTFEDLTENFSESVAQVKVLNTEITSLKKQLAGLKNGGQGSAIFGGTATDKAKDLANRANITGKESLAKQQEKLTTYSSSLTEKLNEQRKALEADAKAAEDAAAALEKLNNTSTKSKTLKNNDNVHKMAAYMANNQLADGSQNWETSRDVLIANLAQKTGLFTKTGKRSAKGAVTSIPDEILDMLKVAINKQDLTGQDQAGGIFENNISQAEFIKRVTELFDAAYTKGHVRDGARQVSNSDKTSLSINAVSEKMKDTSSDLLEQQKASAQKTLDEANSRRAESEKAVALTTEQIKEVTATMKALEDEIKKQDDRIAELEAQLNDKTAKRDELKSQTVASGRASLSANASAGTDRVNRALEVDLQTEQEIKAEEDELDASSQRLGVSLTDLVKRAFGVATVFREVTKAIRSALNDIKQLDSAMTNIAVVTDMTTEELWGQIDGYMTLAKQYGVTTQGVYEVSQLYYQQGLKTSEVNELTGETLKMARIAGMNYADAADAMTVALRSFNMEMSQAATVTDVYSKVASISATDSNELAIAMSKTASGAANVGSSFENTTSMLAVMINSVPCAA